MALIIGKLSCHFELLRGELVPTRPCVAAEPVGYVSSDSRSTNQTRTSIYSRIVESPCCCIVVIVVVVVVVVLVFLCVLYLLHMHHIIGPLSVYTLSAHLSDQSARLWLMSFRKLINDDWSGS